MLERYEGNVHPQHLSHLPTPHAGAVHHNIAPDIAFVRFNNGHTAFIEIKPRHQGMFVDLAAPVPGTFGHGLGDPRRVGLAVGGHEGGSDHVGRVHDRK